jgi:hypothetical protein
MAFNAITSTDPQEDRAEMASHGKGKMARQASRRDHHCHKEQALLRNCRTWTSSRTLSSEVSLIAAYFQDFFQNS